MRKALIGKSPNLSMERSCWDAGYEIVAGLDEVGKGAWAGPLTIVALVPNRNCRINGVRDSKMLKEAEREKLFDRIDKWSEDWSLGHASNEECDELGMSMAQRIAARRAIDGLIKRPDRLLLDGTWDFVSDGRSETIVRGDQISLSIAAASIMAKVSRDRIMKEADKLYPDYDFSQNKGYPSPKHRLALESKGATFFHRRTWGFMKNIPPIGAPYIKKIEAQTNIFELK
tara:strand:+ start:724 stop:1410 length:687 start_codon:yes stop_codon:yes gene_type:complete